MKARLFIAIFIVGNIAHGQQIEIAVQKGHSGPINALVFSPDGKLLASTGSDNLLKLWHVPSGKEMGSFVSTASADVAAMRISSVNDTLTVTYHDGAEHSWDVAKSVLISTRRMKAGAKTRSDYYTLDSSMHIFIDRYFLRTVAQPSGEILFTRVPIDISKIFKCVAVSERNRLILAGSEDGNIYVWNLDNGRNLGVLEGHYSSVNTLDFSDDETIFASGSSDRSIIIWNTVDLKQIKRLHGQSFRLETLAFNHSGTQLAVGDEMGTVRIMELRSSRVRVSASQLHEQKVSALAFSAGDSILYSGGWDNRHNELNQFTGKTKRTIFKRYVSIGDWILKKFGAFRNPYAWINTIDVDPNNRLEVFGGGWRESAIRRQPQRLFVRHPARQKQHKLLSHKGSVNSVCVLNENTFLTGGDDGLLQWRYDEGSGEFYYRNNHSVARRINTIIAAGRDSVLLHSGKTVLLYDIRTEKILDSIKAETAIEAIAFDMKSKNLVYSTINTLAFTSLRRWHAAPLQVQAHTDKITSVAFNPTRPMVATCSWDATTKLWNAESGELIATIIGIGKDDHIIVTPDNYYYGTRNSLRGIGFKYGKQFISPEQYDLRFNRPDIVLARLGFVGKDIIRSFHRAYLKRLQKMNFTEGMLSAEIQLPQMRQAAEIPLVSSDPIVPLTVEAIDSKYNLDRINIYVNNVPLHGSGGVDLRAAKTGSIRRTIDIPLSSGKNTIQFSCLNEKGVASLMETTVIHHTPSKTVKPRLFVAVVSVSAYKRSEMDLKYARKDGQDLVNMFSRSRAFSEVKVDSLYDARATRDNILKLREHFSNTTVDDHVILFVSGHGLLDENLDFYFATHDIDFANPADAGLPYEELEGLLDGIPARQKLLLMDACHSGEVDKTTLRRAAEPTPIVSGSTKGSITAYSYPADIEQEHYQVGITTSFELMQELFSNLSKGSGAIVISAAAGNSYALESDEWRNGVFTFSILHGLKSGNADLDNNGSTSVRELKEYVSIEVQRLTKGAQKPTSRNENLEYDFAVW